jgi:DNA-directed RNA polymerase specialized sigma24 family protein
MYKDRRRTKAAGMVSLELVPEQMVDRMTPDRKLQRDRINAAVGAAIDTLPRNQRDVVDLICFGGVSREDAAVMLGCSQQDVAYAVRWARTALRQQLAGYA